MPTIIETIIDYEPDLLGMIAEGWGIDLDLAAGKTLPKQIAGRLQEESLLGEVLAALPKPETGALVRLAKHNGRLPLDQFEREFGALREMGATRREKQRPDRNPVSITENLFYKGLIARAFFQEGSEAREFIYLPDEFQAFINEKIIPKDAGSIPILPGHTAARTFRSGDYILDHACTLLSALRIETPVDQISLENPEIPARFLIQLLNEAGLTDKNGQPNPEKVGAFLEAPRSESFFRLVECWRRSGTIREVDLLYGLDFEGDIQSNPVTVREKLLTLIQSLSSETWLQIDEFCAWVKTYQPDILRTGGEYDAWIIKDRSSGQYIKGFEYWEQVEGALLGTMIRRPLFWMGIVDLGAKIKSGKPDLFRLSKWAADLLAGRKIDYQKARSIELSINKDGGIIIDRSFPLSTRYQIARFCDWKGAKKGKFHYRISHPALQRATRQGLQVDQLITLLNKFGKKPIPPTIPTALERWKQNKLEAVFEQTVILRVRSSKILDQLSSSRVKSCIINRLNDTTAIVKADGMEQLRDTLLDMGILADFRLEV